MSLEFLKVNLNSKDRGKECVKYLDLFHVLCNKVPASFSCWLVFSLLFQLLLMYLQISFLLPFMSLARFNVR